MIASTHPVLKLLRERQRSGSQPRARTDGHTLALAIEGGGMRGGYSAGMVAALEVLGFGEAFDAVYGCSAGALNGAYFLADQALFGSAIYFEDLPNRRFMNPLRMIPGGRPIVDMNYAIDYVYREVKPLKVDRVINSSVPLHIFATDSESGQLHDFFEFDSWEDLRDAMQATTRIPFITGISQVEIKGRKYIDPSIDESVPVGPAESDGATHILVLRTRPNQQGIESTSLIQRRFLDLAMTWHSPALAGLVSSRSARYRATAKYLTEKTRDQRGPPYCFTIAPDNDAPKIHQISRDSQLALAVVTSGFNSAYATLT